MEPTRTVETFLVLPIIKLVPLMVNFSPALIVPGITDSSLILVSGVGVGVGVGLGRGVAVGLGVLVGEEVGVNRRRNLSNRLRIPLLLLSSRSSSSSSKIYREIISRLRSESLIDCTRGVAETEAEGVPETTTFWPLSTITLVLEIACFV